MTGHCWIDEELLRNGAVVAGRYEIVRPLGPGGMAHVYLARDRHEGAREVALKILKRDLAEDETFVKRFIREVELMNAVDHCNVVKPYDIGRAEGLIFYSMEYVPSMSLARLMSLCSFDSAQIAQLAVEICSGLSAIHAQGIVHRDLKPANLLIRGDGSIKITDFGIARPRRSRLTSKFEKVGSYCYMAPESWRGETATRAVDLYSLGVVLYELAVGDVPFDHGFAGKLMEMHLTEQPEVPSELNPRVPEWLDRLILCLLEKSPSDRPESAEKVIAYIRAYVDPQDSGIVLPEIFESLQPEKEKFVSFPLPPSPDEFSGPKVVQREPEAQKTYCFRLSATHSASGKSTSDGQEIAPSTSLFNVDLFGDTRLQLELERPTRDLFFFLLFIVSLQTVPIFFGLDKISGYLSANLAPGSMIVMFKVGIMLFVVGSSAFILRQQKLDAVSRLSCVYLGAAIVPWVIGVLARYSVVL